MIVCSIRLTGSSIQYLLQHKEIRAHNTTTEQQNAYIFLQKTRQKRQNFLEEITTENKKLNEIKRKAIMQINLKK